MRHPLQPEVLADIAGGLYGSAEVDAARLPRPGQAGCEGGEK